MKTINIRESLINLDKQTDFKYSLTDLYEACRLDDDKKNKLVQYIDGKDVKSMSKMLSNEANVMTENVSDDVSDDEMKEMLDEARISDWDSTDSFSDDMSDPSVAYSIYVFNNPGEYAEEAGVYDDPEEAKYFADTEYPDAYQVVIREEKARGRFSGVFNVRLDGEWKSHDIRTMDESLLMEGPLAVLGDLAGKGVGDAWKGVKNFAKGVKDTAKDVVKTTKAVAKSAVRDAKQSKTGAKIRDAARAVKGANNWDEFKNDYQRRQDARKPSDKVRYRSFDGKLGKTIGDIQDWKFQVNGKKLSYDQWMKLPKTEREKLIKGNGVKAYDLSGRETSLVPKGSKLKGLKEALILEYSEYKRILKEATAVMDRPRVSNVHTHRGSFSGIIDAHMDEINDMINANVPAAHIVHCLRDWVSDAGLTKSNAKYAQNAIMRMAKMRTAAEVGMYIYNIRLKAEDDAYGSIDSQFYDKRHKYEDLNEELLRESTKESGVRYDLQDLRLMAKEAYDKDDTEFWSHLTDEELRELWKGCQITKANPYGAAYDDEVYDEMEDRGLFNKNENYRSHLSESIDEEDKPFTHSQVFDELKRETANFSVGEDRGIYSFEKEVKMAEKILKKHYETVKVTERGNDFMVEFSGPKNKKKKVNESKSMNEDKSVDELQFKDTQFEGIRVAQFSTGDDFIVSVEEGTENGETYYYISMKHPFDDSHRYVVEVGDWDNPESAVKAAKEATDLLNSESDAKEFKTSLGSQKFLVDARKVYKRVAKKISSKKWVMAESKSLRESAGRFELEVWVPGSGGDDRERFIMASNNLQDIIDKAYEIDLDGDEAFYLRDMKDIYPYDLDQCYDAEELEDAIYNQWHYNPQADMRKQLGKILLPQNESLLGKRVQATNSYGKPVGKIGKVVSEDPKSKDHYGNYDIEIEYEDGSKEKTRAFFVEPIEEAYIEITEDEPTIDEIQSRVQDYLDNHPYSSDMDVEDICEEVAYNLFDLDYHKMSGDASYEIFNIVSRYVDDLDEAIEMKAQNPDSDWNYTLDNDNYDSVKSFGGYYIAKRTGFDRYDIFEKTADGVFVLKDGSGLPYSVCQTMIDDMNNDSIKKFVNAGKPEEERATLEESWLTATNYSVGVGMATLADKLQDAVEISVNDCYITPVGNIKVDYKRSESPRSYLTSCEYIITVRDTGDDFIFYRITAKTSAGEESYKIECSDNDGRLTVLDTPQSFIALIRTLYNRAHSYTDEYHILDNIDFWSVRDLYAGDWNSWLKESLEEAFEHPQDDGVETSKEWEHKDKDGKIGRIRQSDGKGDRKPLTRGQAKEIAKFRGHGDDELYPVNESSNDRVRHYEDMLNKCQSWEEVHDISTQIKNDPKISTDDEYNLRFEVSRNFERFNESKSIDEDILKESNAHIPNHRSLEADYGQEEYDEDGDYTYREATVFDSNDNDVAVISVSYDTYNNVPMSYSIDPCTGNVELDRKLACESAIANHSWFERCNSTEEMCDVVVRFIASDIQDFRRKNEAFEHPQPKGLTEGLNESYSDIDWNQVGEWFDWSGCEYEVFSSPFGDGCEIRSPMDEAIFKVYVSAGKIVFQAEHMYGEEFVRVEMSTNKYTNSYDVIDFIRENQKELLDNLELKVYGTVSEAFEHPQNKGPHWYLCKHGIGPGAIPKGVTVMDTMDDPENPYKCYVALDKVLTTDELKQFEMTEQKPPMKESLEDNGYEIKNVKGHFEVYKDGKFAYSADSQKEAEEEMKEREDK